MEFINKLKNLGDRSASINKYAVKYAMGVKVRESFISLILLSFLLAGCVSVPLGDKISEGVYYIKDSAGIQIDEYNDVTTISGEAIINQETFAKHTEEHYFLRTFISGKVVSHQVYADLGYHTDWLFYNGAAIKGIGNAEFTSLDRDVKMAQYGSIFNETVVASFPDSELRNGQDSSIQFYSKSGQKTQLTITARQKQKQIEMIDSVLNQ